MQRMVRRSLTFMALMASLAVALVDFRPLAAPTPSLALEGSDIVWAIDVDPPEPTVGDSVVVTAVASGLGYIPAYYLSVAPEGESAPLVLDGPPDEDWPPLGFPVSWHLTAVRAGEASLKVSVHYDKVFCVDDPPVCSTHFVWSDADVVTVHVASEPTPTASPIPTPTPTPTVFIEENMPGDVNCDIMITSTDAGLVLQYSAGLVDWLECSELGDLNKDCNVDSIDALLILQIVAGLIELPTYKPCPTQ